MDEKEKKHSTDSKDAERSFVIINGKRVYGINAETDEVVSAGKVYPIYTFESNHLEDSWVCSICDTENPERSSSCCVCGQARTSKNKAQSKFEKHSNWRQDEHKASNETSENGKCEEPPKTKKSLKWLIVGILIAVLVVVAIAMILSHSSTITTSDILADKTVSSASNSVPSAAESTPEDIGSTTSTIVVEPASSTESELGSVSSSVASVTYTITYNVSGNGTLSGDGKSGKSSIQCTVSETEAGKSITVTAVPGSNYQFTRWSDGVTKATRTDTNFNTSKTLTAYFEQVTVPEYSVIYRVSGSGSLSSGNASGKSKLQYSVPQGSGKSITVTAVPGNNYHFVRWSDGYTGATRTDSNIGGNIDLTAYFEANPVAPAWSASASMGADGVITVAVDSAGQSIKVSVKMVYVADPNKVYSMGTIGTWTTGNYRFEPSCPGDSGEYSIRFYDQNGHLLTSVNATL